MIPNKTFWGFWAKVKKTPYCWEWKGNAWTNGHPLAWCPAVKRTIHAHRMAFYLTHGRFPNGQAVKKCQVKWCVRPDHIVDVQREEIGPILRKTGVCRRPRRKVCRKNKHKMTPENSKRVGGQIRCRECFNEKRRAYWHRSLKFRRALKKH